jgi:hypothetical protein
VKAGTAKAGGRKKISADDLWACIYF